MIVWYGRRPGSTRPETAKQAPRFWSTMPVPGATIPAPKLPKRLWMNDTAVPSLYAALRPRAVIMNNGVDQGGHHLILKAPHPSPLSASRGFFGSRPFSRANELLEKMGADPIDWRLPG